MSVKNKKSDELWGIYLIACYTFAKLRYTHHARFNPSEDTFHKIKYIHLPEGYIEGDYEIIGIFQ